MISDGTLVLLNFPQTDSASAKLRPALVLRRLPGDHDDFLVCMISSKLHQAVEGFDDVVRPEDGDFSSSGLKMTSVIRISRLAVLHSSLLLGSIGAISSQRLTDIRQRLSAWIRGV